MDIIKVAAASVFSWLILFVITRIQGSKQISQLTFFDYISGITIGSIAAEMATELEAPVIPFAAIVVWGALTMLADLLTRKSPVMRRVVSGEPTVLLQSGRMIRKNFKKAGLDVNDFLARCRVAGYFDLSGIELAVLENSGQLSILPREEQRPTVLSDIKSPVKQSCAPIPVILDGHVSEHSLRIVGKDRKWLDTELHKQDTKASEVFLATCDCEGNLCAFPNKEKNTNSFFTV